MTRFAERTGDDRVLPIIECLTGPLRVRVRGRAGVGRRTVAAALSGANVEVMAHPAGAELTVLVIAETAKPEDRAVLAGCDGPVLCVLNKADLAGLGGLRGLGGQQNRGPMAVAQRRAADIRALTGAVTVPLAGLLAAPMLDDELRSALRVLATEPADLTTTDEFRRCAHRLDVAVRERLLNSLDRFGIAHAVLALSRGAAPAALADVLRRASGFDHVLAELHRVAAPARYRRVRSAIAELNALAVRSEDRGVAEFLAADDTVIAVMADATEVVQAAGLAVDPGELPGDARTAHLRRAVHWRRYSRGPVDALHRACGADICRGSLRLLGQVQP